MIWGVVACGRLGGRGEKDPECVFWFFGGVVWALRKGVLEGGGGGVVGSSLGECRIVVDVVNVGNGAGVDGEGMEFSVVF